MSRKRKYFVCVKIFAPQRMRLALPSTDTPLIALRILKATCDCAKGEAGYAHKGATIHTALNLILKDHVLIRSTTRLSLSSACQCASSTAMFLRGCEGRAGTSHGEYCRADHRVAVLLARRLTSTCQLHWSLKHLVTTLMT
eukprot:6207620-Pleurochrysis_carterae.AAC.1